MSDEKKETTNQAQVPAVPDYMKKFVQQNQSDASSMATASISVPRLSYRGKRFRFIENGEEELVKEFTVKVVILGVEPDAGKFIKTFYLKGYQPGDSDPPSCSSTDGIRPDSWVTSKQADLCSACAQNVFGSATSMSGGKSKACKDGKRLWVSKPANPGKFYGLNVPVMSLKNLSEYGKYIGRNNFPLSLVVTEIGLDDSAEYPKLTFAHAGFVEEAAAEVAIKINTERPWRSTFGEGPIMVEGQERKTRTIPAPSGSGPANGAPTGQVPNGQSVDDVVGKW